MMISTLAIVGLVALLLLGKSLRKLHAQRKASKDLPQPPYHWLYGHLYLIYLWRFHAPPRLHLPAFFTYIQLKYALPSNFYLDLRPFGPLLLLIGDPVVASRCITNGQNLPRESSILWLSRLFFGSNNILTLKDHGHKAKRALFAPAFSARQVGAYTPLIVDSCVKLASELREKAHAGEVIELQPFIGKTITRLIASVVLGCASNEEDSKIDLIGQLFKERTDLTPKETEMLFFNGLNPLKQYRFHRNTKRLNEAIACELDRRIAARAANVDVCAKEGSGRCVVDYALSTLEQEQRDQNITASSKSVSIPTALHENLVEHARLFMFAGTDSLTSTICYIFYLLHLNPTVAHKLKVELDTHLPADDIAGIASTIKAEPHIINKLEYTNAIIKETLRLFPPAGTVREFQDAPGRIDHISDEETGQTLPLRGTMIFVEHHLLGRNEKFFPEPLKFVPERFIQSQTPYPNAHLFELSGRHAWRPFEQGVYNCIGQYLAMAEMRILLALLARDFDFTVEFPGDANVDLQNFEEDGMPASCIEELEDRGGRTVRWEGYRLHQINDLAGKPAGYCPGRVRLRR